jgi:uncharacterized protein DUF6496
MPTKVTLARARADARQRKSPSTQAGEFVREEMHQFKHGSGTVRSRQQAIATGLSEARRAGVKLPQPKKGRVTEPVRQKAARDAAIGAGRVSPSPARSRGARQAARTRARRVVV